jgi:hypothetical protein
MSPIKRVIGGVAGAAAPDDTMVRVRFRTSLDALLTLAIAMLAIVLAVGYQVLSRWGDRILGSR